MSPSAANLNDELAEFLSDHQLEQSFLSTYQIEGIITSMAAAPYPIDPNEWISIFWGYDTAPPFSSAAQLERFAAIIVKQWNKARKDLLTNQWQWPEHCKLDDNEIISSETRQFCEGFLQGWQLTKDDWQTLIPENDPNSPLIAGVLLSVCMLFEPEKALLDQKGMDLAQFAEIYQAMPIMLSGITMKAAELAQTSDNS